MFVLHNIREKKIKKWWDEEDLQLLYFLLQYLLIKYKNTIDLQYVTLAYNSKVWPGVDKICQDCGFWVDARLLYPKSIGAEGRCWKLWVSCAKADNGYLGDVIWGVMVVTFPPS